MLNSNKTFLCLFCAVVFGISTAAAADWVGTWSCGIQLTEPGNLPPAPGLSSNTLRQVIHVTLGGKQLRLRLSNLYGTNMVTMNAIHVALNVGDKATSTINATTDKQLTFQGQPSVAIPPGQEITSDAADFDLPAMANLTITIHFGEVSPRITGHPGSRTTSYILPGNKVTAPAMPEAVKTAHWYFIAGIDVPANDSTHAIAVLGDSITDGRGSTTGANNRWPDALAVRLHTNSATASLSVLNLGIGGNAIFGGLGPAAQKRFKHDILDQNGVRWLILFEGVNDIGGSKDSAVSTNLIAAYQQFIEKAHAKNIKVYGATITPIGESFYYTEAHEAARQTVNTWIRTNQMTDAVIDFDTLVRNPAKPGSLLPDYDVGDHLHLSPAGYQAMADGIDLNLFLK
jgi:lysophospholipase L1-like esterase